MFSKKKYEPTHIAITGASSGIGAELAFQYAATGKRLALFARREALLKEVADRCNHNGAMATVHTGDVRNVSQVRAWIELIDANQPVDLLIINAGVFDGHGTNKQYEGYEEAQKILDTNLAGAIYTAQAALPKMLLRKSGHIAFIGSLAAISPLPDAPTYSASKAAVAAFAKAWAHEAEQHGVNVSLIYLGHVSTAQTDIHEGSLPFCLSASQAAKKIRTSLENQAEIAVIPPIAGFLARCEAILPISVRRKLKQRQRFSVAKRIEPQGLP